jgi:hypothetical protein
MHLWWVMIVPSIKTGPACEVTEAGFYAIYDTILRSNVMIFMLKTWHRVYICHKNRSLK